MVPEKRGRKTVVVWCTAVLFLPLWSIKINMNIVIDHHDPKAGYGYRTWLSIIIITIIIIAGIVKVA